MNDDLAFLHTAAGHVETFQAIVDSLAPGIRVCHQIAPELLARAQSGDMDNLHMDVGKAMLGCADGGARVVVCTCSTIGSLAEAVDGKGRFHAMRIDRPMAREAVIRGGHIVVLAALTTTLEPTAALIRDEAVRAGRRVDIEMRLIPAAWAAYLAGHVATYHQMVANAIAAAGPHASSVVLAQASMAPAVEQAGSNTATLVLSSPETGVRAALAQLGTSVKER